MPELPLSTSSPEREPVVSTARYEACRILKAAGLAFCIWAEDALTAYGVPTVCFELYLMTDNVAGAVEALVQKGYIQKAPEKNHPTLIPEFSKRCGLPGSKNTDRGDIILLDTTEWNYTLADTTTTWLPPLNKFMDSLMYRWTDESSRDLRFHLGVHIGYIFMYVPECIRQVNEFAMELQTENRQLYYDLIDGPATGNLLTVKCQEHYRMVREQIRRGEIDPTGQSDVVLFPDGGWR